MLMTQALILLVDDDRLILHTLSAGLRDAGYRTLLADSGEAAVEIAKHQAIDLAIIDARMLGMSGTQLAAYFRDGGKVPFIFLSAYDDVKIVRGAVSSGALGYLVKPLDVAQIVPSIEAALMRAKDISGLRSTTAQLTAAVAQGRQISVATGLLMERHGLDKEQAFNALRTAARSKRRNLDQLADEVIAGKTDVR